MSVSTPTLRHSELMNRLVLERQSAQTIGHLDHLEIDPQGHHIEGLVTKSGLLGREKHYFAWRQVDTVGEDGIFVNGVAASHTPSEQGQTVIGHELWTNTGNKVGKVVDYVFNPETSAITAYLFASNGWRGVIEGIYLLEPVAISSVGEKRVIALEAAIQRAKQYSPGVQQKVEKAKDALAQDYARTKQDVEGVVHQVQNKTQQLQENWQTKQASTPEDEED